MAVSYVIRPMVYRGKSGFLVRSRGGAGWPISIFAETREDAEAIRESCKREDWDAVGDILLHRDRPAQINMAQGGIR